MSEIEKIILTSCLTVVTGVVVYVIGRFSENLFIEPIHRLRSLLGEIMDTLIFYKDIFPDPQYTQNHVKEEAIKRFRYFSSRIVAVQSEIPWYPLWRFIGVVRKRADLMEIHSLLIRVSSNIESNKDVNMDILKKLEGIFQIELS